MNRMMATDTSGKGASVNSPWAYAFWAAASPNSLGPTKPPRLPIMLMKPIADAAAAAPMKMVGIGQNAGRCAYMNVPTPRTMIATAAGPESLNQPAKNSPRLRQTRGTATWPMRSWLRSECQPLTSMPARPATYGRPASTAAQVSDTPDCALMMVGMNMDSP